MISKLFVKLFNRVEYGYRILTRCVTLFVTLDTIRSFEQNLCELFFPNCNRWNTEYFFFSVR